MSYNYNVQKSKNCFQSAEELREKEWMKLEGRIMRRALVLWRGRGKARVNALSAWRRAERELLPGNGKASALAAISLKRRRKNTSRRP